MCSRAVTLCVCSRIRVRSNGATHVLAKTDDKPPDADGWKDAEWTKRNRHTCPCLPTIRAQIGRENWPTGCCSGPTRAARSARKIRAGKARVAATPPSCPVGGNPHKWVRPGSKPSLAASQRAKPHRRRTGGHQELQEEQRRPFRRPAPLAALSPTAAALHASFSRWPSPTATGCPNSSPSRCWGAEGQHCSAHNKHQRVD